MNASQINTAYNSTRKSLYSLQLVDAFRNIDQLVKELQIGEYSDRLDNLEQNYRYLLKYYIDGIDDPERKTVYNKLISNSFTLVSELREELLFRNSTGFEYTQKRYFPHNRKFNSTADLIDGLRYYHHQTGILRNDKTGNHETEETRLRANFEGLLDDLFGVFWLTTRFSSDDRKLFTGILDDSYPGITEKCLSVSALTLNLWRMFDENKLMLLFDACTNQNREVSQRALVGICFVLARFNDFLPYFPAIRNRLVLLGDNPGAASSLQNIIIQIISTAETDKITKKMQEEILPEMMKISPLLKDKMDADSIINVDEFGEENPEWQEILDKNGITEKLQELSELQLEGADVYMSTFSLLKNFAFFSNLSHWFLPFDPAFSDLRGLFQKGEKNLLSSFVNSMIMCNSDKYSFCLSLLQMPEKQREMMKHSMSAEAEQMDEMTREEAMLTPENARKNMSKQYIQDLFRFFRLYPQHNEFKSMFDFALKMHKTYLFSIFSSENNFKSAIAEYYFAKNHYFQAIELFENLIVSSEPSAALYQKTGYAYQQTSQLEKALDAYRKADIIQPDDLWTVRKMALCYRMTGNFEKALEYYHHADYLRPEQASTLLQTGHCYLEMKKYREALNIYYKLDAMNPDNEKVLRAIVWCNFVSGNIQQADYHSVKLIQINATAQDFLNAGHIAWCENKPKMTLELYLKSLELWQNNFETFLSAFEADRKYLMANGVDEDEISLMLDNLKLSIADS